MSNKKCRQAIEARIATWAAARSPALTVAWQNVPFTAPDGLYLQGFLLPADTISQTLDGAHRRYLGLYQITVRAPINAGAGAADSVMDEIATLFPVNLRLTVTGLTLQVISPVSSGPGAQVADRYVLPVSFGYRADTT